MVFVVSDGLDYVSTTVKQADMTKKVPDCYIKVAADNICLKSWILWSWLGPNVPQRCPAWAIDNKIAVVLYCKE
ncbi:hypothetical protein GCM10027318_37080 [Massilia agilis]